MEKELGFFWNSVYVDNHQLLFNPNWLYVATSTCLGHPLPLVYWLIVPKYDARNR